MSTQTYRKRPDLDSWLLTFHMPELTTAASVEKMPSPCLCNKLPKEGNAASRTAITGRPTILRVSYKITRPGNEQATAGKVDN